MLVERAQAVWASVDVLPARGLPGVAAGLECRHDRLEVAGRERALVLGHDLRLAQLRVGLQQRRAVRVAAVQRPAAEVDPQLVHQSVGHAVGDDRDRQIDSPGLAVEMENHLLEAARLGDDVLDVLDRDVALREPRVRFADERLERPRALDPSSYRVVQLGLAGERLDQRVGLPGHKAGEVGDGVSLFALLLFLQPCQHGGGEQLGNPGHA